jgi:hypothetical protein
MAIGQISAPKEKAPCLNMTQYSLFTHTPSGKINKGGLEISEICSIILVETSFLSLLSNLSNQIFYRVSEQQEETFKGEIK